MNLESIKDQLVAFEECRIIALDIDEPVLRKVALQVLDENKEKFLSIKGSDWEHHNYTGGLIVHVCSVAFVAEQMAKFYGDSVNLDLVRFGALMHDVGKLFDYRPQTEYVNSNVESINRALLGHSVEGVTYIMRKLQEAYADDSVIVDKEYAIKAVVQAAHCVGAHMDNFGACAKQQMLEVLIIGCADKVDAYVGQTVVKEDDDSGCYTIGTGETFYKAAISSSKVLMQDT
jgi:3'-5' exoribonuclease